MKTVAVVPARMGSSRLPGKMMMPIGGQPLLGLLLNRVRQAACVDEILVATATTPDNDIIASYCAAHDYKCFRGDESDVLRRIAGALAWCGADHAVLIYGDQPMIAPEVIVHVTRAYFDSRPQHDLVGNDLQTTYPPGMDMEVFAARALAHADANCCDSTIREHATLYLRQNPDRYTLMNVAAPAEHRRPDLSFEVDAPEDVTVISALLSGAESGSDASLTEMIAFMDAHPNIAALNRNVERRWKQFRPANIPS